MQLPRVPCSSRPIQPPPSEKIMHGVGHPAEVPVYSLVRSGSMGSAADWDLGRYRALLRVLARRLRLDPRLRAHFDESDIVQEAMLRAHANLNQFRGSTEAELIAWLQQILANACLDLQEGGRAQKRDVALERSLQAAVGES